MAHLICCVEVEQETVQVWSSTMPYGTFACFLSGCSQRRHVHEIASPDGSYRLLSGWKGRQRWLAQRRSVLQAWPVRC